MARELTNSAVEQRHRWVRSMIDDRDVQRAVAACADDFTLTLFDQGGWVVRRDQVAALFEDILNTPETINWSVEAVALRGDRLCLTRFKAGRSDSGFGSDWLFVWEIDAAGLVARSARLQNEHLKEAHDCLNQWWIEGLSPELAAAASAVIKLVNALEEGDQTALDEILADTLIYADHRPLSFGQVDKHDAIDLWLARRQESPGYVVLIPTMERLTSSGAVCASHVVFPDSFATNTVTLMILEYSQFTRMEFFDTDDLDTALARFEELT